MLPEAGKTYIDSKGNSRTVTKIYRNNVYYTKNLTTHEQGCYLNVFIKAYMGDNHESKPLDQAFKQLDKQLCRHHNVRKDHFFSAMVYLTCKDCGKPLN